MSDERFHFGLGDVDRADELTIEWPDGTESVQRDVDVGQLLTVAR